MDDREAKATYLQHCVSENLNHARHVENERLTYTSIYIAMVIGAVAVVFGLENNWVAFTVSLLLSVFGLMSLLLNMRWQGVFDNHIEMAKLCQQKWKETLPGLELPESGYYYGNYGKTKGIGQGLRRIMGESVADAKKHEAARLKRKQERLAKKNRTFVLPDENENREPGLVGSFFKEMARTRRMFALLYLLIFLALIILTGYLFFEARESATGGGFYFSVEARRELESALTHIVEEVLK